MNKEDKDLLLKDLCSRVYYQIKVLYNDNIKEIQYVEPLYYEVKLLDTGNYTVDISDIKPYLRPMSSMTEEEKKELLQISSFDSDVDDICYDFICFKERTSIDIIDIANFIGWLNAHHFDYRTIYDEDKKKYMSMIEKGLAIAVTKENNPYENN